MFKIVLFPMVIAIVGAIILGSYGVMRDEQPGKETAGWPLWTALVGGMAAEGVAIYLFNQDRLGMAFLLGLVGMAMEGVGIIICAGNLFVVATPIVAQGMDRLQLSESARQSIRKIVWNRFRRFQKSRSFW